MVERDFGFLKDDMIVNSLFLKTPSRIEALGPVPVPALMVRRLMERTMRRGLQGSGPRMEGWNKQKTSRPTSFMMTTMFSSALVFRTTQGRSLRRPFTPVRRQYLAILGVSENIFITPILPDGWRRLAER